MTSNRAPIYLPTGLSPYKRRQQRSENQTNDAEEGDCANEMVSFHRDYWGDSSEGVDDSGAGSSAAGLTVIETDFLSWLPNESLSVSVTV